MEIVNSTDSFLFSKIKKIFIKKNKHKKMTEKEGNGSKRKILLINK
jgi:hypothetical protein